MLLGCALAACPTAAAGEAGPRPALPAAPCRRRRSRPARGRRCASTRRRAAGCPACRGRQVRLLPAWRGGWSRRFPRPGAPAWAAGARAGRACGRRGRPARTASGCWSRRWSPDPAWPSRRPRGSAGCGARCCVRARGPAPVPTRGRAAVHARATRGPAVLWRGWSPCVLAANLSGSKMWNPVRRIGTYGSTIGGRGRDVKVGCAGALTPAVFRKRGREQGTRTGEFVGVRGRSVGRARGSEAGWGPSSEVVGTRCPHPNPLPEGEGAKPGYLTPRTASNPAISCSIRGTGTDRSSTRLRG